VSLLSGGKGYPAKYRFFRFFRLLPQQTDALPVLGHLPVSFQNIVQAYLQYSKPVIQHAFVSIVNNGHLVNNRRLWTFIQLGVLAYKIANFRIAAFGKELSACQCMILGCLETLGFGDIVKQARCPD
jgi:hypothetical protein